MEQNSPAELQQVVGLLQKLGKVEVNYPMDLLAHRQAAFLDKVSAAREPVGANAALGSGGLTASAKGTLLHFALGAVLVGELAIGVYLVRDLWLPWFQDEPTPIASNEIVETLPIMEETEMPTETVVPTETEFITPVLGITPIPENASPPDPTPVPPSGTDIPGRHLGQTPGPPEAPGATKKP